MLVPAKAGGIDKGVGEDARIHTRMSTTRKQLVVVRIAIVIVNNNSRKGNVVELKVGNVVELVKEFWS